MKTTTLTVPQRDTLQWLTEDDRRVLLVSDDKLKAKGLIEKAGSVGRNTAYRISAKGRKVLKYNQDKRAIGCG